MSAQSGQRGEKRETWVSRHYDLRTEVWRGCTPKVSEFEGCSEPSPVRFVGGGAHLRTDLEGGSVPIVQFHFSVPSRGTGVRGSIRRSLLSDGNMIFAFFALGQVH